MAKMNMAVFLMIIDTQNMRAVWVSALLALV
jgi:hypothetical protein